jgi:hypothetical protein
MHLIGELPDIDRAGLLAAMAAKGIDREIEAAITVCHDAGITAFDSSDPTIARSVLKGAH